MVSRLVSIEASYGNVDWLPVIIERTESAGLDVGMTTRPVLSPLVSEWVWSACRAKSVLPSVTASLRRTATSLGQLSQSLHELFTRHAAIRYVVIVESAYTEESLSAEQYGEYRDPLILGSKELEFDLC